ncbi:uncharacterized protein LOC105441009 isoform X1 [Strongylocentrotus purpuratus]|uniref:Uncharacterized protein n=1 Tax=Strongylocentrotus purpuratus TaxID=7668 RepID=A0A7M7PWG2_STRPU|nr:uncharacterized protein LOC105441009 isoform X1 [Strongylocentrotus purpuratus]
MADDHRITVRTSRSVRSQLFGCHPACASNVWALMTSIALLGVGVYFVVNSAAKFWIWVYLFAAGGIVLLLEMMTLFTYTTCCRQRCGKCIKAIWFIDTWKRGLVYVIGGIFCFIPFSVDLRLLCEIRNMMLYKCSGQGFANFLAQFPVTITLTHLHLPIGQVAHCRCTTTLQQQCIKLGYVQRQLHVATPVDRLSVLHATCTCL